MHCVSSYPLKQEHVNFPKLLKIKELHKQIGYSGHLKGIEDAIAAITFGALIVEKHFTINNDLPGRDNKFALLPHEMKTITNYRDIFVKMNIDNGLDVQECEMDIYKNYREKMVKKLSDFTIVIRAKNEERWIGYAIQSVLDHLTKPEIIIVDNNSTDKTLEIVKFFLKIPI